MKTLKIKEFADMCGCSIYTLRYYDAKDLLKPSKVNDESGYRYYTEDQITTYQKIRAFQEIGFSVKEIREMQDMSNEQIAEMILDKIEYLHELLLKSIILMEKYKENREVQDEKVI